MKNQNFKLPKEYNYLFLFMDKNNNIIETQIKKCWNKKDAILIAANLLGNLSHNDIVKIKTKKQF
jgi:hypothetical protein